MADTISNPSGSIHRIPALKGTENYNTWRIQMEDVLTDLDLYGHVNQTIPCPAVQETVITITPPKDEKGNQPPDEVQTTYDSKAKDEWSKKDRKALSQIRLRVDGHALTHIQSCTSSADAWNLLASTFQVQGTVGLIDLRRKFFSHRMTDGEDVEEHIRKMREWYQQINDISPSSCNEVDWITTLVASLPDSWDSFTQSVDFVFDTSDKNAMANRVADLCSRILAEAHWRTTRGEGGRSFFSTSRHPGRTHNTRTFTPRPAPRGPDKSNTKCNNCGKLGHWAAECRQPGGGAHTGSRNNSHNGKSSHGRPPNRLSHQSKHRGRDARAHLAVIKEEEAEKEPTYAFSAIDTDQAMMSRSSSSWVADSGTTTHIARDRNAFTKYRESTGVVSGVTGAESIIGRGTITLQCLVNQKLNQYEQITLQNVAHVPTCPTNLISLSLVTDQGYQVELNGPELRIVSKNKQTIALGRKTHNRTNGNLWHMICKTVYPQEHIQAESERTKKQSNSEIVLHKQTGRTWYEWHKILGHVGAQILQRLKNTGAVLGMEIADSKEGLAFECKSCMQAKLHVRPFPKESANKIKKIGELIVTNVWGPARTTSIGRYKYYVSFTDVATRFTVIGFLRHKDETLQEYISFEAMVNTQKGLKIQRVRFDNGGEFVNANWQEHTKKMGTILETTAPYSAQQNGIAEHLNRTLVEHVHAMLLESGAPKFLWSEALAYACYIKNRVPTQVHGTFWPTPFELFWGKKPDVGTLQQWGSKCYVLNQGENQSKLDPKTITATFTGISDTQGKSWRYYKPGLNKILHSRNIAFPKSQTLSGGDLDNYDLLEPVVPPAEGEHETKKDSRAEQPNASDGTGGAATENSKSPITETPIKAEEQKPQMPAHTASPAHASKPPVQSTTATVSSSSKAPFQPTKSTRILRSSSKVTAPPPAMPAVRNLHSKTRESMRLLKQMPQGSTDRIQTRTGRLGQPMLSTVSDHGGVTIKVDDSGGKDDGQPAYPPDSPISNVENKPELTNLCLDDDPYADLPALEPIYPTNNAVDLPFPISIDEANRCKIKLKQKLSDPAYHGIDSTHDIVSGEAESAFATRVSAISDHPTLEEAMNGPERSDWAAAMEAEYAQLSRMGTFEYVPRPPPPANIIGCRWVLAKKRDEHGNVVRFKARLVAKGFTQKPGQDFGDVFAPVLRLDSLRILTSLANFNDLDMRQLDVVRAYLHGELEEELYMQQIPCFDDGSDTVLRLHRSLYGLKQSAHIWNRTLDTKLKHLGYTRFLSDSCVYRRTTETPDGPLNAYIAIHVDDSVVITTPSHTELVVNELQRVFEMRDLGPLRHFLGIQFERFREQHILVTKQTAYIDSIVELAGLVNAYPADTPASPSVLLTRFEGQRPVYPYATMIGKLMYAALCTRPDIAYTVNHLAQFTSCFGPAHITAIKRILRYLKGTSFIGLTYRRVNEDFGEVGYSDADWGASSLDRKSISGHIFMLGGAAVSWSLKKQPTVALSTMEAEYMALAHACTQALWMRQFFEELQLPSNAPTLVVSDNLAALTLSVESQYHGRSKHIDIRHHFMRDIIEKRRVSTLYVPSRDNLADTFTKALARPQFWYLVNTVMGSQVIETEDDYLWM